MCVKSLIPLYTVKQHSFKLQREKLVKLNLWMTSPGGLRIQQKLVPKMEGSDLKRTEASSHSVGRQQLQMTPKQDRAEKGDKKRL